LFIVGNITGNIFFELIDNKPFLRLLLMAGKPRPIKGLRVILWRENATKFFPYLQKGSEIGVIGQLTMRQFKGNWITEVEANHLILMRNINWENGDVSKEEMMPVLSSSFVVGKLEEDPYFEWRSKDKEGPALPSDSSRYAYMHLSLGNEDHLHGLGVSIYGTLAQVAHPYLRAGSVVAIDGHFQTKHKENRPNTIDLTAEHVAFLENINWEAGKAAQKRLMDADAAPEIAEGAQIIEA
jgi:single-stranded DNA-binding protein